MSRQATIEYDGRPTDVMYRGERRKDIFEDDADREMFRSTGGRGGDAFWLAAARLHRDEQSLSSVGGDATGEPRAWDVVAPETDDTRHSRFHRGFLGNATWCQKFLSRGMSFSTFCIVPTGKLVALLFTRRRRLSLSIVRLTGPLDVA